MTALIIAVVLVLCVALIMFPDLTGELFGAFLYLLANLAVIVWGVWSIHDLFLDEGDWGNCIGLAAFILYAGRLSK